MATKIKAGYCDVGAVQFKSGQWHINSTPVSQQIKLDQYPCYSIEGSELGSFVCVIGDTQYNYCNPAFKSSSGLSYTYQEDNPELLSSLWLLEYMDAFYLAVMGTFDSRDVLSVIPVAFNAYDMELHLKELHLYIDIEETTVLGTIVLFDTSVQSTHVHFYQDRADCENICSLCINTIISKGILTSLTPNITGFDASTNTEFVEEMGVVDIHLLEKQPSVSSIQQACVQACDGFLAQGKRVAPSGYLPAFESAPVKANPVLISRDIGNWSSLLVVTSPDDESLAFELSDYMEAIEGDYDDDDYELLLDRHHMLIALVATSQVCGFTAQDYSLDHFKRWLSSQDYVSVLEDCLQHDFLFPDAIAFYAESGLLLHGEDYTNIEAIISGEYAIAIYDKVAESCGSAFSLEYAKMMQTRKSCFREGKSNRATLPSKIPFAEWGFGRDVALLYFAYTGIMEQSYLPAVNKYVLWDYLCTGPYLNPILMSCASRSQSSGSGCVRGNFQRGDAFMMLLSESRGKKTQFGYANRESIDLSPSDLTKLSAFETTYRYAAVNADSRIPTEVRLTTYIQWLLLSCNMVTLSDAIPRGLGNTEIVSINLTLRAVCYMLHLWMRSVLGTIEEGSDPVCKYAPFAELSWKQMSNEWILQSIATRAQWLPYGWLSWDGETQDGKVKTYKNRFVTQDVRGHNRVLKGFEDLDWNKNKSSPYSYVKGELRRALLQTNHHENSGKGYYTSLGLFELSTWSFIPACYEFSENERLRTGEGNTERDVDELTSEVFSTPFIPYTVSVIEYVQRTVNALLALSDKNIGNSFFNQYLSTLKLFNKFFKPLFSISDEAQFRSRLILTTCYIQTVIPEYTLESLSGVLQETSIETAWDDMLKKIHPGGVPAVADICKPPEPQLIVGNKQRMSEDLESLLKSLETISLDEVTPVIEQEYVHPALSLLNRDASGLYELQPRSILAQRLEERNNKANSEATAGLDALEQGIDDQQSLDTLYNDLDTFLGAEGGLSSLETGENVLSNGLDSLLDGSTGLSGLDALESEANNLVTDTAMGIDNGLASLEAEAPQSLEATEVVRNSLESDMLSRLSAGDEPENLVSDDNTQPDDIEYLYNSAAPDSTSILIQQIGTRHPALAFKLLAIIPLDESAESLLIEPTIKAVTDLCDTHNGYCYFDSEDALRVNMSGVEYYVLQVNNAERRAKNALSNGMLTYKYYGSVLPKVLGSAILT